MKIKWKLVVVAACVGVLRAAAVEVGSAAGSACAGKSKADDCISLEGCQWCAAANMSAAMARCRRRPGAQTTVAAAAGGAGEGGGWCPGGAEELLDPAEVVAYGAARSMQETSNMHSPERIDISSRLGTVRVHFQLRVQDDDRDIYIQVISPEDEDSPKLSALSLVTTDMTHVYNVSADITTTACPEHKKYSFKLGTLKANLDVELVVHCRAECPRATQEAGAGRAACGGRGIRHCGVCECDDGWSGPDCAVKRHVTCQLHQRGDQPDTSSCYTGETELCAARGECVCGSCVCATPEQQFDNHCRDFCSASAGACALCHHRHRDQHDRRAQRPDSGPHDREYEDYCRHLCGDVVTVHHTGESSSGEACAVEDTERNCLLQYRGGRVRGEATMWLGNCSGLYGAGSSAAGDVRPARVIVGAVAGALVLGVAAAVAAVLLWRAAHMPADSAADSAYKCIEANNTEGENPLYRPPVSSYANPLWCEPSHMHRPPAPHPSPGVQTDI